MKARFIEDSIGLCATVCDMTSEAFISSSLIQVENSQAQLHIMAHHASQRLQLRLVDMREDMPVDGFESGA
jgi:hypothetical protein